MPHERDQMCSDSVRRVLDDFGKIGLLVDDNNKLVLRRTARELYGAEALPKWWLVVGSVQCAESAIGEVVRLMSARDDLLAILLLDRLLPLRCDQDEYPAAWDDESKVKEYGEASGLRQVLHAALGMNDRVASAFQTSYPGADHGEFPWENRSSDVLTKLRHDLSQDDHRRHLLRYGPVHGGYTGRDASAQFRRRHWDRTIRELAIGLDRLANNDRGLPIVLVTGAGASLANAPGAPGMPKTAWLLDDTFTLVQPDQQQIEHDEKAIICACRNRAEVVALRPAGTDEDGPTDLAGFLKKMEELNDRGLGSEAFPSWTLTQLFHGSSWERNRFADGFRTVMFKYDVSFPYQHWLLSQLRWTLVMTTNFDCYHERAGSHVVSHASALNVAERHLDMAMPSNRYWKLYGSLSDRSKLALSLDEIQGRTTLVAKNWTTIRKTHPKGLLVVLGHAMRDNAIFELLNPETMPGHWDFLWVVPDALKVTHKEQNVQPSPWIREMSRALKSVDSDQTIGGPLPATALEFAYDLYFEYQSLRRSRRSRVRFD